MSKEIKRPNLKDPIAWATIAETYAEWVRLNAPKHGIDVPKYMLGDVLGSIIGDDSNCFGFRSAPYDREMAITGGQHLQIRLDWEISTPELPENIRQRLVQFRSEIDEADWDSQSGFSQVREAWSEKVKQFVQAQIDSNPELREAIDYELEMAWLLSKEWQEFLYG